MVVGFLGVVIYAWSRLSSQPSLPGVVLTIINVVFWALYSIYFRKMGNMDALRVTGYMFIYGSAMMAAASIMLNGPWGFVDVDWGSLSFIYYLLGTSIIGGAALFLMWYLIVNEMGISNAVSYIFVIPALTIVFNYLILGIKPTMLEILGSGIMFIGIYLSTLH